MNCWSPVIVVDVVVMTVCELVVVVVVEGWRTPKELVVVPVVMYVVVKVHPPMVTIFWLKVWTEPTKLFVGIVKTLLLVVVRIVCQLMICPVAPTLTMENVVPGGKDVVVVDVVKSPLATFVQTPPF